MGMHMSPASRACGSFRRRYPQLTLWATDMSSASPTGRASSEAVAREGTLHTHQRSECAEGGEAFREEVFTALSS